MSPTPEEARRDMKAFSELKYQENILNSRLYHVPREIISHHILRRLQLTTHYKRAAPYWSDNEIDWVRALLVCRHIREAALEDRGLWSVIDLNHKCQSWIELCVERAGEHPLEISGALRDLDKDMSTVYTVQLFHNCRRIRICISIHSSPASGFERIFNKLLSSDINGDRPHLKSSLAYLDPPTLMLATTGHPDRFTHLTELQLQDARISEISDPLMLPALRHLELKTSRFKHNFEDLRTLLQCTPKIMTLIIDGPEVDNVEVNIPPSGARTGTVQVPPRQSPVQLPSLSYLEITGLLREVGLFLHHNVVPYPSHTFRLQGAIHDRKERTSNHKNASDLIHKTAVRFLEATVNTNGIVLRPYELYLVSVYGTSKETYMEMRPFLDVKLNAQHVRQISLHLYPFGGTDAVAQSPVIKHATAISFSDSSMIPPCISFLQDSTHIQHLSTGVNVVGMESSELSEELALIEGILAARALKSSPLRSVHLSCWRDCFPSSNQQEFELLCALQEKWRSMGWIQFMAGDRMCTPDECYLPRAMEYHDAPSSPKLSSWDTQPLSWDESHM